MHVNGDSEAQKPPPAGVVGKFHGGEDVEGTPAWAARGQHMTSDHVTYIVTIRATLSVFFAGSILGQDRASVWFYVIWHCLIMM